MSKKPYNQSNKSENEAVVNENEEVKTGVTPEEDGVNSINETEADKVESADQAVSVADTQESDVNGQEDGSATKNEENVNNDANTSETADVESTDDVKTEGTTDDVTNQTDVKPEETEKEDTQVNTEAPKESGYFVSLGVVEASRMSLVKERLMKAGINSAAMFGDELVVGPFTCKSNCIEIRKKILSKGLKCSIVEK